MLPFIFKGVLPSNDALRPHFVPVRTMLLSLMGTPLITCKIIIPKRNVCLLQYFTLKISSPKSILTTFWVLAVEAVVHKINKPIHEVLYKNTIRSDAQYKIRRLSSMKIMQILDTPIQCTASVTCWLWYLVSRSVAKEKITNHIWNNVS